VNEPSAALVDAFAPAYRVERELGRGATARVYLAEDVKHQRRVAIKVLREEIAESIGTERFLQEIMVAAGLSHPHIVPLLDSGKREGALYYVMPAIEGETLRERLTRESPMAIADALRITSQIADALSYSHSRGIIHRDVKPENVLIARSGHALVLDFGIARAIRDAETDRMTQTGFSLGTPAYMSPEQASGERDVDARTDQYSLAMMCYEMLTGTTPFSAPSLELSLRRRFTERAPSVRAVRPEVGQEQDEALQRAMATAPEDRYATIAEFVPMLLRARNEQLTTGQVARRAPVVAVLPLTNISSDPENQFLADGIAEEILGALAQLKALRVVGRSSSFAFRGDNVDVRKIAEQLHATHVLSGSMRRSGAKLRVSAQLVTTADGQVVWSDRYDRELVDVFAIQDEIAAAVSSALRLVLVPSTTRPAHTPNLKAHELFLQARALYLLGPARYAEAKALIDRGMAMDPESIAGRSLLAGFLANTGIFGMVAPRDAFPAAKAMANQVLVDGPNAFALYVLGLSAWLYDWDTRQARRLFEESLLLSDRARALYATLLVFTGETERALQEMAAALTEDPFDANNRQQHVDVLWYARRMDDALAEAMRLRELFPESSHVHFQLAKILFATGKAEEALPWAERAAAGRHPNGTASLVEILAALGRRGEAQAILDAALARSAAAFVSPANLARMCFALGEKDQAFVQLDRAAETRDSLFVVLGKDPLFDSFRSDARFEAYVRKVVY
jgi:serine/threonine protein kinase